MDAFYVWCPDDGDRPLRCNIVSPSEKMAAEQWFEAHWSDLDHASEVIVRVDDVFGHRFEFRVCAERSVTFIARGLE